MRILKNLALIAGLFTLLASCNPNGAGIFYTIVTEKKVASSELSNKAVYKIASDGPSSMYVLAGRTIYKGDGTDGGWSKINPPENGLYPVSLATAGTTPNVYAVFEKETDSSFAYTFYSLSGDTWTSVSAFSGSSDTKLTGSKDLRLVSIEGDSANIFVSSRTSDGKYAVYSFDGSAITSLTPSGSEISSPVIGAAKLGTNYYLTASDTTATVAPVILSTDLTVDSLNPGTVTVSGDLVLSSTSLGGITVYGGNLYLTAKDGFVYSSSDGSTWSKVNNSPVTNYLSSTAALGAVTTVPFSSKNYLIIAGLNGYYEMDLSGSTPVIPNATSSNFSTYDLSKEIVFSVYTKTDNIYLGSSKGLWLASYSNGEVVLNQK